MPDEQDPICPVCGDRHSPLPDVLNEAVDTVEALLRISSVLRECSLTASTVAASTTAIVLARHFKKTHGSAAFEQASKTANHLADKHDERLLELLTL